MGDVQPPAMNTSAWCLEGFVRGSASQRGAEDPDAVRLDRTGVSVSDSAYTTEKIVEKIFAIVIHTGGIAASAEAAMARRGRTDASAGRSGEQRCRKTSRA